MRFEVNIPDERADEFIAFIIASRGYSDLCRSGGIGVPYKAGNPSV